MNKFITYSISLICFLSYTLLLAQDGSRVYKNDYSEHLIESLAYKVLNADNDKERLEHNTDLTDLLKAELSRERAFRYPFYALKSIGVLTSPDSVIRIFNWSIPFTDGTYSYETILLRNHGGGEVELIQLKKIDSDTVELESFIGNKNQWPGALYYDIIEKEAYGSKYYTLLAWDGQNRMVQRKWIEVFWFDVEDNDELKIGAPLFKKENTPNLHRVVFRYSAQNKMSLNYREDLDRLEFDHLVPPKSSLKGIYSYYGSDLSFDSYYWRTDFWEYQADIDIEEGIKKRSKDFKVKETVIREKKPIYNNK